MSLLRHLPNFLTCCNLICGCFGIILTLRHSAAEAAIWVWAACLFDFFDGFAARRLNVHSPIGKELDSLADMVSFGVLPSVAMFQMIGAHSTNEWLPFTGFSIAIFSALRLAKFNIDERQSDSFIGLPTPANALFVTGLVFLGTPFDALLTRDYVLIILTILSSMILVAPLELFALKFKNFTWLDNRLRFTFLFISVLLLALWQAAALPLIILGYVLVSLMTRWVRI